MEAQPPVVKPFSPTLAHKKDAPFYSILHICNVLFESLLLFFCSRDLSSSSSAHAYCKDAFTVGTGAIVSIVAILSGEAETSTVALLSVCCYHALVFFVHIKRGLEEYSAGGFSNESISFVSLVNILMLVQSLYFVVVDKKLVRVDFCVGVGFMAVALICPPTLDVAPLFVGLPLLVLARRVMWLSANLDKCERVVTMGLLCACGGDVLRVYSVSLSLLLFAGGVVLYLVALSSLESSSFSIVKSLPMLMYGLVVYFVALFPLLPSGAGGPMAMYFLLLVLLQWRASTISTSVGFLLTFASIALTLSDSLFALDYFSFSQRRSSGSNNFRYPVLVLHYLGHGVFCQAISVRRMDQKKPDDEKQHQ